MAAARFWRVVGFDTHGGGDLALSALTLSDAGGRIDQLASLTSAHAPAFGTLAALGDGLGDTVCVFTAAVARSPGFALVWDFGAGVAKDVLKIGIGAGPSQGESAERLQLHSSDDGSDWAAEYAVTGIPDQGLSDVSVDYNSLVLASGPVAFWPLDETSGTTAAELVAGRNGTRAGGTLITPGLAPLSPAAFDPATSGLITIPSSPAFDLSTFSVEFWLKTSIVENLVVLERNANFGFSVQTRGPAETSPNFAPGGLTCTVGHQGTVFPVAGSNTAIPVNAPLYCVFTVKPAGAKVYINGVDVTKSSDVMMPSWGNAPIFIGSRAGAYGIPAGSAIDKVALYARELDLSEIAGHYNGRNITMGQPLRRTRQLHVQRLGGAEVAAAGVAAPFHHGLIRDMEYSGRGFIASTVELKHSPDNLPMRRRVRLFHERSGLFIRETWSDAATGNYRFDWIDEAEAYTVISYDYEHDYRAVVADNLTLANGGVEMMP